MKRKDIKSEYIKSVELYNFKSELLPYKNLSLELGRMLVMDAIDDGKGNYKHLGEGIIQLDFPELFSCYIISI